MYKYKDYSGKKYGHLVMLHILTTRGAGKGALWAAVCDCGSKVEIEAKQAAAGRIQTCGKCEYHYRLIQKRKTKGKNKKDSERWMFYKDKFNCEKSGIPFDVEFDKYLDIIKGNCTFCGSEPTRRVKGLQGSYSHLDLINKPLGYTRDNITAICILCREMKRDLNYLDFLEHVTRILNHIRSVLSKNT